MAKTFQIPVRVALAFFVAAIADGLQFGVGWLTDHWRLPGEIADFGLDLIVAAILSLLIGFHPIFLPSFILKAIQIPVVEEMPTWTACVIFLGWSRKREAATDPKTAEELDEVPLPKAKPNTTPRPAAIASHAGSSKLWYLISVVLLVVGLIWFVHRAPSHSARLPTYAEAADPPPVVAPAPVAPKPPPPIAASKDSRPVVAVGPIENQSTGGQSFGRGQPDTSPEKVRTFIEQMLSEINGVNLMERQESEMLLGEWKTDDGLTDAQRIKKMQLRTTPNLIVMVAILDIHHQTSNFRGYNISAKSMDTECQLRLQVLDTSDGSITFSRILDGDRTLEQTSASDTTTTEDSVFLAVKSALQKLNGDTDFQNAVRGVKHEQVQVEFAPKPDNCDIEIDGRYIGGSPLTQKLLSGHEITVRFSKAGFKDWQGKLSPQAGLRVTRELEPVASNPHTP